MFSSSDGDLLGDHAPAAPRSGPPSLGRRGAVDGRQQGRRGARRRQLMASPPVDSGAGSRVRSSAAWSAPSASDAGLAASRRGCRRRGAWSVAVELVDVDRRRRPARPGRRRRPRSTTTGLAEGARRRRRTRRAGPPRPRRGPSASGASASTLTAAPSRNVAARYDPTVKRHEADRRSAGSAATRLS